MIKICFEMIWICWNVRLKIIRWYFKEINVKFYLGVKKINDDGRKNLLVVVLVEKRYLGFVWLKV